MKDITIKIFDFGIIIDDKSTNFYAVSDLKSITNHYRNFNFSNYGRASISKLDVTGLPIDNTSKWNNSIDRAYNHIVNLFKKVIPCDTDCIGMKDLYSEINKLPKLIGKNKIWEALA